MLKHAIDELTRLLNEAARRGTWGRIEIDLQCGRPVLIRETTTRKLNDGSRHDDR